MRQRRLFRCLQVFRLALRAVKYWASQRGISSNVMGYLGGVNLAIMVAKICQLYPRAGERRAVQLHRRKRCRRLVCLLVESFCSLHPHAVCLTASPLGTHCILLDRLCASIRFMCPSVPPTEASTILVKFFILMKEWPWPRAIHLRVPEEHSMGLPVWDPRPGTRDSQALMPVITPAYPAMNSLYNVRRSTLEVGGEDGMQAQGAGPSSVGGSRNWGISWACGLSCWSKQRLGTTCGDTALWGLHGSGQWGRAARARVKSGRVIGSSGPACTRSK